MEGNSHEPKTNVPGWARYAPARDLRNLQEHGGASIEELKSFLGALKGRSPQEVIGIVSASMLIQSMIVATVASLALLAVLTVVPYLLFGPTKGKEVATKPVPAKKEPATGQPSAATKEAAPTESSNTKSNSPDAAKAAKAMGLDEVKGSDPGKNPLDKPPDLDNLLDGIDK